MYKCCYVLEYVVHDNTGSPYIHVFVSCVLGLRFSVKMRVRVGVMFRVRVKIKAAGYDEIRVAYVYD